MSIMLKIEIDSVIVCLRATVAVKKGYTTLQSMMNAKLSKQRFGHYHENGLIKTIQTIPHNL